MANEDTTNTHAETTTANKVVVPVPEPGQALNVTVDAEQIPQLNFDPSTESIQEFVGNDLVFTLDNGAVLTFVDFAASINDGEITSFMLEDGSIIPIDALIAAWNLDVPETAAGEATASGGASAYGDDMGDALGGIDKLGTQNPDPFGAAALATVEDEQTPIVEPIEGVNDAPAITVQTESDTVYEAGLIPEGSGNSPASVTAVGTFTITDTDGLDDIQSISLGTNVIAIGPKGLAALVGESFDAANGTVEITNYLGNGEFAYVYTLTSPTTDVEGAPETDSFNLSVFDEAGSASSTVTIEIIDDNPNLGTQGIEPGSQVVDDSDFTVNNTKDYTDIFNKVFGADGQGDTSYSLDVSSNGADSGVIDSGTGNHVFLFIADGAVYGREGTDAADAESGEVVFTVSVSDGSVTLDQQRAVMHDDPSNPEEANSPVTLSAPNLITVTATISDGDGDETSASVNLGGALAFNDDGPSILETSDEAVDETGGLDSVTGNLSFIYGADGAGEVSLEANGATWNAETTTLSDDAGFWNIVVDEANQEYTFTQLKAMDHPGGTNPDDTIYVNFSATVTDADNDSVTTGLTVAVTVSDDVPSLEISNTMLDETGGLDSVTGDLAFVYGADGAGSVSLAADGATWVAATNTLTEEAGFWNVVVNEGAQEYTFTQLKAMDHPDGTDPNDTLDVNFTATVTDADGDYVTAPITVTVYDDGPTALDDSGSVLSGATLIVDADNGVLDNDIEGADGAQVTSVGPGTQEGSSLLLNPDGSYSYTAIPNASYVDTFTYTITDGDGDTRTADLVITVTDGSPSAPDVNAEVNEAALDMVQDAGEYAAAAVVGSDGQSSTAELAQGTLAATDANGNALTYTPATISGTYGTLEIDAAGNYSYTLTSPVDGPTADDGTNTILDAEVPFQYTVTDVHGNSSTGNITIDIIDDVPTANQAFDATTFNHGDNSFIVTEDLNVEFGADGFGSFSFTGFTDGEAGEVTANGGTSTMTIGGTTVLLYGAGTNQLIGTTNVNDANATVFTVDLNNDGTYTLDMAQTLDSPAQFNVVDLGSLGISGGNGDYFIVGSGTSGTTEDDILITSVQPGGTINTSNADFGTESQWIDPNNGVKFEFVENIEINGTNDGPRTLTGVQVQLATVKGGATQTNVLIALYAGADNIIEDLGEFNSVVTAINYWSGGVAISLNSPAEITQALSEGDIAIVADYNTGGVMISGIVVNNVDEHSTVGITTNTGFDTTDVVNHDGPDFSINGISGAYITNAPVSFDASFTATDGDGDVTTVDTFTMNLDPVIDGTNQADSLTGSGADELLQGFGGNDILVGGDGNDILFGGEDNDTLTGGAGEDTFVFSANAGEGINTITDFNTAEDTLSFHEVLDGVDLDLDGVNDNLDVDAISIILSGDGNADVTLTTDSGTEITLEGVNSGGAFDNFANLGEFLNDDPTAINITTNPDAFGS
jgi:VCBS repeat-containing protein